MKFIHHRLTTLTLASVLGASTSALAATTASDFKTYDSNGDGKISQQEYQAQGGSEGTFRMIDVNGDGSLSHDEFVKKGSASTPPAAPANPATPGMPSPNDRL
ncbi:EF-hand domain-containing protein [Thiobacillus sp.]|uniref:EF-hand domain-containing protein n=1 Tax=Thiobacillus sp. TaxID=924 RepID=UPI00183D07FC|nr:EF-hand domain-containing protein [Thiobacillus sp.]MBC2729957.1 EF-hand domain-containing protein [Thiobacillus sp.]MBC2738694.1 EF-hand domain-containing protein [Thiobacillus sp.]MBC2761012.1 EF-hand domain-containing protein [Thiobacillus sp.]